MQFPDRWLVVRLSALGDVALTTGVLERWHRERGWRFVFLTFAQWAPVLEGHPAIERVIAVDKSDMRPACMVRLFRSLSTELEGYGLLDLHGSLRSRMLRAFWTGRARHYPKFSLERRLFLKSGGRLYRERLLACNVPQRYSLAIDTQAPDRADVLPHVFLHEQEGAEARARLESLGIGSRWVALHPYSTHPNKAWLEERWQELARSLVREGCDVLVVGRGTPILEDIPGVHDLTGKTTLRETCALLAECRALVTGDSGPMHLACGVGTPVVALFGPTHGVWGFYPEGPNDVVLEAEMACRPCSLHGSRICEKGHACMESIQAGQVLEALGTIPGIIG